MQLKIFQPLNIAYIGNNKVASTTIGHILNNELKKYKQNSYLETINLEINQINAYVKENNLKLFTFVRNPYDRAISSYHYRINYYVKKFEKKIYLKANINKFFDGPKGWKNYQRKNDYAAAIFSFGSFLEGLYKNGTDFDVHVRPQSDIIGFDFIDNIVIGKIEQFTDDFKTILHSAGFIEDKSIEKMCSIQLRKYNNIIDKNNYLNIINKKIIYEIYEKDFLNFEYEK